MIGSQNKQRKFIRIWEIFTVFFHYCILLTTMIPWQMILEGLSGMSLKIILQGIS